MKRADWERFVESLTKLARSRLEVYTLSLVKDVEILAESLSEVFEEVCEETMPKKGRFRKSNSWWTKDMKEKKALYRKPCKAQQEKERSIHLETA